MSDMDELAERIITTIEDAAEMSTSMPVGYMGHGPGIQDVVVGIPYVYWEAVMLAVNEYVAAKSARA